MQWESNTWHLLCFSWEAQWGDFEFRILALAPILWDCKHCLMVIWGEGVEGTCINRGDEWPRIVGPGVPRVPLGPRHLHGCDGRLWLWIEELASRPRRRRCRTHLRHTRLIPRTHQPAVNEIIHQVQDTSPVTNPLGATSLPPSDLPSKVITKWSPRAKLEAQLVPSLMTFGGHWPQKSTKKQELDWNGHQRAMDFVFLKLWNALSPMEQCLLLESGLDWHKVNNIEAIWK